MFDTQLRRKVAWLIAVGMSFRSLRYYAKKYNLR
jgi:hypothetical protein